MKSVLLPIGTVVELANSTVPVMIAGYLSVAAGNTHKIWDYSGFLYPIGYEESGKVYSFDHENINHVISYGYRDVLTDYAIVKVMSAKEDILKNKQTEGE